MTDTHVAWKVRQGTPATPSLLLIGDRLVMVDDDGVASCLDAKTGETLYEDEDMHSGSGADALMRLQAVARKRGNVFAELMETVKTNSLGQISGALYAVGGEYRRNM